MAAGELHEGTSFATPFVSAAAALVREYRPELTAAQVVARLLATADPTSGGPNSPEYGHGLVNPYRALTDQLSATARPSASQSPITVWPARRGPVTDHKAALTVAGIAVGLSLLVIFIGATRHQANRRRAGKR